MCTLLAGPAVFSVVFRLSLPPRPWGYSFSGYRTQGAGAPSASTALGDRFVPLGLPPGCPAPRTLNPENFRWDSGPPSSKGIAPEFIGFWGRPPTHLAAGRLHDVPTWMDRVGAYSPLPPRCGYRTSGHGAQEKGSLGNLWSPGNRYQLSHKPLPMTELLSIQ